MWDWLINFLLRSIRIQVASIETAVHECDVDKDGYLDALELWNAVKKVKK